MEKVKIENAERSFVRTCYLTWWR